MPAVRRARSHHRVAEAIEALRRRLLDEHVDDLSRQYSLAPSAEDARKAMAYGQQAARHAISRLAHAEAVALYRQVLELLPRAGRERDDGLRAGLLTELGIAQHRSGHHEARDTLLRAATLAADIGDGRQCARAVLACSRGIFSSAGSVDEAYVSALRRALELVGDDPGTRAMLLAILSVELSFVGDHTEQDAAERRGARHRPPARRRRRPGARPEPAPRDPVARSIGSRSAWPWPPSSRSCGARYGRPQATLNAATMACQAAMEAGDVAGADLRQRTIDAIADQLRQPLTLGYARLRQSMRAAVAGDLVLSEHLADEAYACSRRPASPTRAAFWVGQRFNIRFHQGRLHEVLPEVEQATRDYPGIIAFRTAVAMIHAELGDPDAAAGRPGGRVRTGVRRRARRPELAHVHGLRRPRRRVGRRRRPVSAVPRPR